MSNKILKFGAEWCAPCRAMAPIVKSVAKDYEGKIEVVEIDVDKQQELALQYGITAVPTLIFLKEDEIVKTSRGPQSKSNIKNSIHEAFGV
jgi:thioredoxin 1